MKENPYASPLESSPPAAEPATDAPNSLVAIARKTFLAWEKLRILFVGILGLITVLATVPLGFPSWRLLIIIVQGAIVANLAFFAGPVVETYVRWLGYNRMWPRWLMFISGTMMTAALAIVVLASELLPNQP